MASSSELQQVPTPYQMKVASTVTVKRPPLMAAVSCDDIVVAATTAWPFYHSAVHFQHNLAARRLGSTRRPDEPRL